MKALRWILFSLVAFAIGTGAALALHPPSPGIPTATASKLSGDLDAIARYAADGRCTAMRGRLDGAQSRIDKLPSRTADTLVRQLQRSLDQIRSSALQTCQDVANAKTKAEQDSAAKQALQEQLDATTPEPTTPEPTTPDSAGNDGGPDPGSTEGTTPSTGEGGGTGVPDAGTSPDGGTDGTVLPGVSPQQGEKYRKALEKQLRKQFKDRLDAGARS